MDLICPVCRRFDPHDGVSDAPIDPGGNCTGCGLRYPLVDGVMCVARDVDVFRDSQSWAMSSDWIDSPDSNLLRAWSSLAPRERRERSLVAMYAEAHYPAQVAVFDGLRTLPPRLLKQNEDTLWTLGDHIVRHSPMADATRFLDVGCGPGGLVSRVAGLAKSWHCFGFDLRVGVLRIAARLNGGGHVVVPYRAEGNRFVNAVVGPTSYSRSPVTWVQGDLVHPPFRGESFDVVAAMSLLDTLPNPWFGLGQLDALLSPGGVLVLATPYHWEPDVVPEHWWYCADGVPSEQVVRAALRGEMRHVLDLNYDIVMQCELPWALPAGDRLVHHYELDVVVARKK